jgi:uncharacterized protein YuzE
MEKMMKKEGLIFSYDKIDDILYMSIGKPKEGIDKEVDKGIFVRLDLKHKKPCGIMIVDFEKRFANTQTKPLPVEIKDISYAQI